MQHTPLFEAETDKTITQLRAHAFRLLAGRDYTRKQLADKLMDKEPLATPEQVDAVLAALIAENWLDDMRYAENQVRIKSEQGQGPIKISYQLKQAGVNNHTIQIAMQHHDPDWFHFAQVLRNKKYGHTIPNDYAQQAKQKRFLQSRGYPLNVIHQLFIHNE